MIQERNRHSNYNIPKNPSVVGRCYVMIQTESNNVLFLSLREPQIMLANIIFHLVMTVFERSDWLT